VRVRVDASAWPPQGLGRGWSTDYVAEGDVTPPTALELDGGRLRPSDFDSPRTADPARQAGQAFVRLLREDGVRIRGPVSFARVPPAARSLAAVSSAPLGELVQRMLTESDNDLAEALGRAVARKAGLPPTFTGEARAIAEALAGLGVRSSELSLQDASGLSHDDRVAPTSLVAVLRAAAGGSDGRLGPILDGLPVAGFTGTLADRYRHKADKPGAGVVRAKTGSLTGVNALAGLVVDRAGRLLGFAVLAAGSTDRDVVEAGLDKIAASLAQLT
jgi:D-alanyl-D-alanine carboxypeptidase/D-alanyl-D-alanine-endopeptidase (penicillin-binding protein 4)